VTITDIINAVSSRLDVDRKLTAGFVFEVVNETIQALESGKSVKIKGLGTFTWKPVSKRSGTGVRSGTYVPEGKKLKFVPAKKFRSRRP